MTARTSIPAILLLVPGLLVVIMAGGGGPAAAEEIDREFHQSFEVAEGARLRVVHGDGDVTVTPWERDAVDVRVRYRAQVSRLGWGSARELDVEFQQRGDLITVVGTEPATAGVGFFATRVVEYTYAVSAPAWVALELAGEDGNVSVTGWRGAVRIDLEDGDAELADGAVPLVEVTVEDGDLTVNGLQGELEARSEDGNVRLRGCGACRATIRTADGDVEVRDYAGALTVEAEDGDLELRGVQSGALTLTTADGDVDLALVPGGRLNLEVRTADGDVTVRLPPGLGVEYVVSTADGAVRLDLPGVDETNRGRNHASGRLGDGSGRLSVRTDDGRVTLLQGE